MIRIYDKAVESRDATMQGCVRYEIEFKGDRARAAASDLFSQESDFAAVAGRVSRSLADHGIRLPSHWEPGRHLDVAASVPDAESRLAWFADSVRPALMSLEAAGMLREALVALGLEELARAETEIAS